VAIEQEIAITDVMGITDVDAIQEVVLLAETTTGTEDGNLFHALPHAASVSTQGLGLLLAAGSQGLHLAADTPLVTWTGTAGALNTIEVFSEFSNASPTLIRACITSDNSVSGTLCLNE